jgi:methylmalonyl-CoA mutase cobalamin-binding domain/chain
LTWFQRPAVPDAGETVVLALETSVDVVGASSLAAGHKTLIPELIAFCAKAGRRHQGHRRRRHPAAGL